MLFRRTPAAALLALSVIGLVLLDPHTSTGQPGGGGFGGKDRSGGGFGGKGGSGKNPFTDPETVFNFYAKGGDVIDFSRMDANMKAFAKSGFEKAGLPAPSDNTVITKAQFVDSFSRALAAKGITPGAPIGGSAPMGGGPPGGGFGGGDRQGRGGYGGGQPGGGYGGGPPGGGGQPMVMTIGGGGPMQPGGGGFGSKGGGFGGDKGGGGGFRMTDQDIEKRFADSDFNRDGKLSFDEINENSPLKSAFKESDTNQDGYIDLNEYKAYIAARFGGGSGDANAGSYGSYAGNGNYGSNGRDPRNEKKEELVVAIRYGKLPVGLPNWWDSLDTDKDGQIGLYEWRADGRDVKEFQKMDLDGDGLVAPQEWLRYNLLSAEQAKAIAAQEEIGGSSEGKSGRPSFGGGSTPSFGGNKDKGAKGSDAKGSDTKGSDKDAKNPFRGKK